MGEFQFSDRKIVNVTCFADNSFEMSQLTKNFDENSSEKTDVAANFTACSSSKQSNRETYFEN